MNTHPDEARRLKALELALQFSHSMINAPRNLEAPVNENNALELAKKFNEFLSGKESK